MKSIYERITDTIKNGVFTNQARTEKLQQLL